MVRERVPLRKVRGSSRDGRLIMSLLAGMVTVGGRPYPVDVIEGTGRARHMCVYVYVKHSTPNSAIEQELHDRRVEDRANATSSA